MMMMLMLMMMLMMMRLKTTTTPMPPTKERSSLLCHQNDCSMMTTMFSSNMRERTHRREGVGDIFAYVVFLVKRT